MSYTRNCSRVQTQRYVSISSVFNRLMCRSLHRLTGRPLYLSYRLDVVGWMSGYSLVVTAMEVFWELCWHV